MNTRNLTHTLFATGLALSGILFFAILGIMLTLVMLHTAGEAPSMMQTVHAAGPMMLFKLSAGGIDYGTYEGEDEEDALDAFLDDAGYESREDLPKHIDPAAFDITEMELRNGGARGTILAPVNA